LAGYEEYDERSRDESGEVEAVAIHSDEHEEAGRAEQWDDENSRPSGLPEREKAGARERP